MKATKRSYKLYAAWEYEKEEEDLNTSSEEGWQLVKGGCFSSTFRKDDSVRYVYQLDYIPKIKDMNRYKEMFEEQGWEYTNSTFNGWHYFRKLYKAGDNIADYKIYTDKESLYEMQNRWVGLVTTLFFVYLIFAGTYAAHFIRSKEPSWLIQTIVFALLTVTFGFGVRNLRRRRKGLKSGISLPTQIILPLVVVLVISSIGIAASKNHNVVYHTNFTYISMPEDALPKLSDDIVIKKAGRYKLDLDINTSDGQVQVIIQDLNKNKVFETVADICTISNHKMMLEKGTYHIYYNYLAKNYGENSSETSVNIKLKK